MRSRFAPELHDVEWVTFDTDQARSLLDRERVHYVPFVRPKDVAGTLSSAAASARIVRRGAYTRVVSTGAAVALPFLVTARRRGIGAHYIESAARSSGPSLTGRLLSAVPGIRTYSQYSLWSSTRWVFRGSVFDEFSSGPRSPSRPIRRVVVSLGTQRGFGFRSAVEAIVRVLPDVCGPDLSVLWQTGATDASGLGIDSVEAIASSTLASAVAEADLVIAHAGVGTALLALEQGRCPVLIPRRRVRREHTDDHQVAIAADLHHRALAVYAEVDRLSAADLVAASTMTALRVGNPSRFALQPDLGNPNGRL